MSLPAEDRDQLFKAFGRAFFKRDVDALYETVTEDFVWNALERDGSVKAVSGRDQVSAQLNRRSPQLENVRFEDVVYHHAPDATFMTFRLTATNAQTGQPHEEVGVERYTFRDGRIAIKDVYRKAGGA
jgi:ketosteroid isomerase-like protein